MMQLIFRSCLLQRHHSRPLQVGLRHMYNLPRRIDRSRRAVTGENLAKTRCKHMEHYRDLLHLRFAARVIGWREIEPSRETGALKFYGLIDTGKGPQRREVPDYSNDLDAMWAAEQYLHRLGLTSAYINALAQVTRASDLSDHDDLFKLVCASPAQRCEAGLQAYDESQTNF